MPTPAERRALLFVAAVAALGTGVRALRALRSDAPPRSDREALATQIARVDSVIATGGRRTPRPSTAARRDTNANRPTRGASGSSTRGGATRADPLAALRVAPLDLDVADSSALDILPGIGPALAARIVADRQAQGPFGSLDALQRVKGVGPALAARIAPYVTFSRAARQELMPH